MRKIAVFASGSGSNAENIIHYFKDHPSIKIECICTNNPNAGVIERGNRLEVPVYIYTNEQFKNPEEIIYLLNEKGIDVIVLAGFLRLISPPFIEQFPSSIVNIHPALLPAYGGKGMFGHHVHEAVVAAKENYSGITIHEVNSKYDEGAILFQAKVALTAEDTPDAVAEKIHQLEYIHFPKVIEQWLKGEKITGA